jgi:hypothetical protein
MDVHQCDVILHSFSLSATDRLSIRILTALAENPLVWRTRSPTELAATAMAWKAVWSRTRHLAAFEKQAPQNRPAPVEEAECCDFFPQHRGMDSDISRTTFDPLETRVSQSQWTF